MLPICDDELEVQKESRPFVVMVLSAADDVVVFLPTMSLAGDQSVGEKIVERCRRLQSWIAYCRRALTPGSGVFVKTSSWLEVRGAR